MGLDISYCSGAKLLITSPEDEAAWLLRVRDGDPYEAAIAMGLVDDEDELAIPWEHPSFPGRAEGIRCGLPHTRENYEHFRAGSYSGYSRWRRWLAAVVGISDLEAWWADPDMSVPFAELLAFSDCEGVIGPVVSAKLRDDFERMRTHAIASADEYARLGGDSNDYEARDYFLRSYDQWHEAFKTAANGGWVDFH